MHIAALGKTKLYIGRGREIGRDRRIWLALLALPALMTAVTWWFLFGALGLPERGRLSDPAGLILGFAFSPDGKTLATTGQIGATPAPAIPWSNTVKMWDAATLRPRPGWEPPAAVTGWVRTFSPDGRLAAGNLGSKVLVWETASGVRLAEFDIPVPSMYRFQDLAFTPDGTTLMLGMQHCVGPTLQPVQVFLWDTATWRERGRPEYPVQRVNRMVFSADRRTLATGTENGEVRLWDVASSRPIAHLDGGPGGFAGSLAFSPDGTTLAVGYHRGGDPQSGTIWVWDCGTHRPLAQLSGKVEGLAFSRDGRFLAGAGLRRRDIVPNSVLAMRALRAVGGSAHVNEVKLWDLVTDREWLVLSEPFEKSIRAPLCVALSPDGKTLVTTSGDGSLRFWSVPGR